MNVILVEWIFNGVEALLFGCMAFVLIKLVITLKEGFGDKKREKVMTNELLHNLGIIV